MLQASKKSLNLVRLRLCGCTSRFAICASMCTLISHDLISFTTGGGGYEFSLLSCVCTLMLLGLSVWSLFSHYTYHLLF